VPARHASDGCLDQRSASLRIPCEKFAVCLCGTDQAGRSRHRRDQRRRVVLGRFRQEFAHRSQHPARKLCGRERQCCIGSRPRRQRADRRLSPDDRPATAVNRASDRIQPRGGSYSPNAGLSRKEVIQASAIRQHRHSGSREYSHIAAQGFVGCRRCGVAATIPDVRTEVSPRPEDGMTTYDSRSTIKTRSPPALWVCTLLGIVLRCRVRDHHKRQIYRSDCDRGRRVRDHACVLDQGMGRIPVADPARRALARLGTRTAHPAGIRRPHPDLLPPCRAVRIGPHPLRAELRPLAPEWLDDADLRHLRRARRHLDPVRLPVHQRLGSWIPGWRRPDFARSGLAALRASVGAEDSVTGRGIRQ
jgi:hypothetical protein